MSVIDHLLALSVLLALPAYAAYEARRVAALTRSGVPIDRPTFYRQTIIAHWCCFALLLGAWIAQGRPMSDLGYVLTPGNGIWIGAATLLALSLYLGGLLRWARQAGAGDRQKHIDKLGDTLGYLPQTDQELRLFAAVSVTAGIVEETVFRAFLLWYLQHGLPLWPAVAIAAATFGLVHSYQGLAGMAKTGLLGLCFCALYVWSGSIYWAIAAHVLLDLLQGIAVRELLRDAGSHLSNREAEDRQQRPEV